MKVGRVCLFGARHLTLELKESIVFAVNGRRRSTSCGGRPARTKGGGGAGREAGSSRAPLEAGGHSARAGTAHADCNEKKVNFSPQTHIKATRAAHLCLARDSSAAAAAAAAPFPRPSRLANV